MRAEFQRQNTQALWLSIGAVLSAIGASACCVGPWLLLSLGIGGAFASTLTSMQSVRPVFIALTLTCLVLAFRKIGSGASACKSDRECGLLNRRPHHRIVYWLLSLTALVLLLFPEAARYFLG